jgi:hypothetical protein
LLFHHATGLIELFRSGRRVNEIWRCHRANIETHYGRERGANRAADAARRASNEGRFPLQAEIQVRRHVANVCLRRGRTGTRRHAGGGERADRSGEHSAARDRLRAGSEDFLSIRWLVRLLFHEKITHARRRCGFATFRVTVESSGRFRLERTQAGGGELSVQGWQILSHHFVPSHLELRQIMKERAGGLLHAGTRRGIDFL